MGIPAILKGSSPSTGATPTFTPGVTATPFDLARVIDRLAAQHGPDAEVIDLARRVAALATRENTASGRVGTIEDYVTFKGPQHPMRDDARPGVMGQIREMDLSALRAMLECELPNDPPSEWVADVRASIARMEAYHAAVQALEARLDLARTEKRRRRMFLRLIRWATRLTAMQPATQAGLKAKAEAQLAVDRAGNFDTWTQGLAASVGRDAVRIIAAEIDDREREAEARDAELLSLITRHATAMADWTAADEMWAAPYALYTASEPPRPAALYWRMTDRFGTPRQRQKVPGSDSYHLLYADEDILALREGETPCGLYVSHPDLIKPGPISQWLPDPRAIARKAEILAAWDTWEAQKEAVRESTGLNAVNAAMEAAADRLNAIEDAIFGCLPRTFDGLQAKARWIASTPLAKQHAEHVLRDLCRMSPPTIAAPIEAQFVVRAA